jgi:DNA replication protein DnaC
VDTSSANNDNGGFYNASNPPNAFAFATLQADGSIKAWGHSSYGGTGEPQSGKTELMIALTAKLLDKGNKTIIILLNLHCIST